MPTHTIPPGSLYVPQDHTTYEQWQVSYKKPTHLGLPREDWAHVFDGLQWLLTHPGEPYPEADLPALRKAFYGGLHSQLGTDKQYEYETGRIRPAGAAIPESYPQDET